MRLFILAALLFGAAAQQAAAQTTPATKAPAAQVASAEKGRAGFIKNGCWQCHGFQAQGGVTGPALAPDPKPFSFVSVFVRNTAGAMPPYQKGMLSDEDLADIYAYLQSIPKARDYKTIPLLNP